jgi:hypothetical protein
MKRPAEEEKRRKDRDASHKERRGKEVMTGSLTDSVCETGALLVHPVKAYLRDSRECQQPAILVSTGKNSLISARRGEPDPSRYNQRTDKNDPFTLLPYALIGPVPTRSNSLRQFAG